MPVAEVLERIKAFEQYAGLLQESHEPIVCRIAQLAGNICAQHRETSRGTPSDADIRNVIAQLLDMLALDSAQPDSLHAIMKDLDGKYGKFSLAEHYMTPEVKSEVSIMADKILAMAQKAFDEDSSVLQEIKKKHGDVLEQIQTFGKPGRSPAG